MLGIVASVVVLPYFVVNTGFMHEITREVPSSISLGIDRMLADKRADPSRAGYGLYVHREEVASAQWIAAHMSTGGDSKIFTDQMYIVGNIPLVAYAGVPSTRIFGLPPKDVTMTSHDYIYYGYMPTVEHRLKVIPPDSQVIETMPELDLRSLTGTMSRIYSNGASEIYR